MEWNKLMISKNVIKKKINHKIIIYLLMKCLKMKI